MSEPVRMLPAPSSVHWLGDREDANKTGHAMDIRGCVLYFEQQSDCLQFMRWLETYGINLYSGPLIAEERGI